MLTPFSPFDIKCKKINKKNLWKCIFRASRRVSFIFFQIVEVVPNTFQNFCECYNIQVKPYATPIVICSLRQEILNGQKVLLTVVTQLLNPTLKCMDNFRLRQLSIPSAIYMFKVSKKQ